MDLNLTGKVGLVTGASRGIGRAISRRLADEGVTVAVAARDETQLRDLAAGVESRTRSRTPLRSWRVTGRRISRGRSSTSTAG